MNNKSTVDSVRHGGMNETAGVFVRTQETHDMLGSNTTAAAAVVLAGTTYYPTQGFTELRLWIAAKGAAHAGGDTLTIKFFKEVAFGDLKSQKIKSEIETAAPITVDTPAVADGYCDFIAVPDTTEVAKSAAFYTISGTITVAASGYCVGLMGKQAVV